VTIANPAGARDVETGEKNGPGAHGYAGLQLYGVAVASTPSHNRRADGSACGLMEETRMAGMAPNTPGTAQ
jgi:hypothetical protein